MKELGLFDNLKKTKNAEWVINRKPTVITIEDSHLHCVNAAKEYNIFFADIKNIEKQMYNIKIETTVKEYKLTPKHIKGASDLSEGLYSEIVEGMSKNK